MVGKEREVSLAAKPDTGRGENLFTLPYFLCELQSSLIHLLFRPDLSIDRGNAILYLLLETETQVAKSEIGYCAFNPSAAV